MLAVLEEQPTDPGSDYPNLFSPAEWDYVQCRFMLVDKLLSSDPVSNVNIVPFVGDRVVMVRLEDGSWEIPGGTLEPEESYREAICRELLEEAGARMLEFELFGAWICHSSAPGPFRPHIPHPDFWRLVGYGDVEISGAPQEGGEHVVSVDVLPLAEAVRRFTLDSRPELAELYLLAAALRQRRHGVKGE